MFFDSRKIKHSKALVRHTRKILRYKEDILAPELLKEAHDHINALDQAIRSRSDKGIDEATAKIDEVFKKIAPARPDDSWRENCEVFLVAIIIAVGIRAYFLQPFKIPTGSMYPTLNGFMGVQMEELPPNPLMRVANFAVLGRHYINTVAKADETIVDIRPVKSFVIWDSTQVTTSANNVYTIGAPEKTLHEFFQVRRGARYKAGDVIARGHVDQGDHVFVDKFSYNFVFPKRGDVFVFKTLGIATLERRAMDPSQKSQHYIKRIGGQPGDELRIDHPELFINGELAREWVFQRVMSCEHGYGGYFNGDGSLKDQPFSMPFLRTPKDTYKVPEKEYFALGDNSAHSSDSRDWGSVPEKNVVGRGFLVYWPFNSHWSLIR